MWPWLPSRLLPEWSRAPERLLPSQGAPSHDVRRMAGPRPQGAQERRAGGGRGWGARAGPPESTCFSAQAEAGGQDRRRLPAAPSAPAPVLSTPGLDHWILTPRLLGSRPPSCTDPLCRASHKAHPHFRLHGRWCWGQQPLGRELQPPRERWPRPSGQQWSHSGGWPCSPGQSPFLASSPYILSSLWLSSPGTTPLGLPEAPSFLPLDPPRAQV